MIVTIIAGGPGMRLWPLSTPELPKHLLTVKGKRSFLQTAYDRAKRLTNTIYVVTLAEQLHIVKEQLPDLPDEAFVIEPARRNTSGCFLATLHFIQSRHDADEPIALTWADHFIRDVDGFVDSFRIAGNATKKYGLPVLVGIEPTYPSTVLGYIHKAELLEGEQLIHKAAGFKEKPALPQAQEFFRTGEYLWNGGYLVGTLNAFTKAMEADCPALWAQYQSLLATKSDKEFQKTYLSFESVAIDYTFSELVKEMLVVTGTFDWMDLGTFQDLYIATEADKEGNAIVGGCIAVEETTNSYVRNDCSKPVAVIGLDNVVVVNTPAGILVARKDLAHKIREVYKQLEQE